jgi:hopanoid biosynthesis associated protein HpnK
MACRLIITADDFGASPGVNQAVAALYDEGAITSASLMVAGPAAREAAQLARERPGLAVGLHLVLAGGLPPVCPPEEVSGLTDRSGRLHVEPLAQGARITFHPGCRAAARAEVTAQLKAFDALGLGRSHLDFHLHFGLTPAVTDLALELARPYPLAAIRVPEDDWRLYRRLDPADALRKLPVALHFASLCPRMRRKVESAGYLATDRCYGLFRSCRLTADYLERLVPELPDGLLELHCHPDLSTDAGRAEFEALRSPDFRRALEGRGVTLCTYAG